MNKRVEDVIIDVLMIVLSVLCTIGLALAIIDHWPRGL